MQVVWYNVHVRGAGRDYDPANAEAVKRLRLAADEIEGGRIPHDPGIRIAKDDPGGGGGGPCTAEYISIQVNVTAAGLPEAKKKND